MKHKINLCVYVLLFWQFISYYIDRQAILPYPKDVFLKMITMLGDLSFYTTIFITLSHVLIVVGISILIAFLLAYLSFIKPVIEEYVSLILSFIQAIPNISYIILVMVWSSSLLTVYIVLFLVVFPLLYNNFIEGFKCIDQDLNDMIILYHPPLFDKLWNAYLPLIQPSLLSGIKSSLSLGVKVGVMAEILAALPYGVGREIQFARIQVDMVGVFAWTLWIVFMIMLIEAFLNNAIKRK